MLTVSDQGVGMGEEDLAQACNAFFRGRSATVAEAEGIGLGLAISRHMADLMHSDLRLESRPGAGTRVSIRLQCVPAAAPAQPSRPAEPATLPLEGWLVAVLENDRLAREALCAWLEEAGARVACGASLAQLQEALRAEPAAPDFIVADFRLAEGTGVEAIEALRNAHGEVPAVIISGEPDITERGLPDPVLQKPVTPDKLLEVLRLAASQGAGGGGDPRSRMLKPARAKA
jgi:CheY-like chemotaxis protein